MAELDRRPSRLAQRFNEMSPTEVCGVKARLHFQSAVIISTPMFVLRIEWPKVTTSKSMYRVIPIYVHVHVLVCTRYMYKYMLS